MKQMTRTSKVALWSMQGLLAALFLFAGGMKLVMPIEMMKGPVDLPGLFGKRARILVSHGGDHLPQEDFPRLAQWALDGKLDLASMVTRTAPLEGWEDALSAMRSGDVIRTVLLP